MNEIYGRYDTLRGAGRGERVCGYMRKREERSALEESCERVESEARRRKKRGHAATAWSWVLFAGGCKVHQLTVPKRAERR